MAYKNIGEFAKEIDVQPKEVIKFLNDNGFKDVKHHKNEITAKMLTALENFTVKDATAKPKAYIFKSRIAFTLGLTSSGYFISETISGTLKRAYDPSQKGIKCVFNDKIFPLNEAFAKGHGKTVDEIYQLMIKHPDYGITFSLGDDVDGLAKSTDNVAVNRGARL